MLRRLLEAKGHLVEACFHVCMPLARLPLTNSACGGTNANMHAAQLRRWNLRVCGAQVRA